MNKHLLLALAGVGIGGLAHAQSNVTLYGRLNTDVEHIRFSDSTTTTSTSQSRVTSNSSRFGLRGSEALGGGVSAIFQIENGFNVDDGTGGIASRDTFVGLSGGFGRLRLGFMDTPFKGTGGLTDRFLGTGLQDDGAIAALGGSGQGFSRRQTNSVRYDTPTVAGLNAELQWAWQQEAPPKQTVLSTALNWRGGPVRLVAAYEQHRQFVPGFVDAAYKVGGNFDIGPVNVGLAYSRLDYERAAGDVERDAIQSSIGIKLGNATINARYTWAGDGKGSAPVGTLIAGSGGNRIYRGPNSSGYQATLGAEYSISRRTSLFAYYTMIDNDANANYRFGTNGLDVAAANPGADPSAFVLGLVHNF